MTTDYDTTDTHADGTAGQIPPAGVTTDMILPADAAERPRLWRLALMLDENMLDAVIYSTVEDSSLRHLRIELPQTAPSLEKALEEAVYSHPFLLADYGRVDFMVRTERFTLVPAEVASDADALEAACTLAALTAAAGPADECARTLHADPPTASGGPCVVWALDENVDRFVARTFRNPALQHHLTPMLRYFTTKAAAGNTSKVYIHLHRRSNTARVADIMAFGANGRPTSVTSIATENVEDVAYQAMAAARAAGFDCDSDQFMLCGDSSLRDELTRSLRRFAAYVMPVIFPSAVFRAGGEAIGAPFPLVILPLCE